MTTAARKDVLAGKIPRPEFASASLFGVSGYQAPPVVYPSPQGVSEVEEAKARQASPSREVVGN